MDSRQPAHPEIRAFGLNAAALVVLAAALLTLGLHRAVPVAREASVYEAVCRSVLDNARTGRQALVCSAWWPPVPALLRMPLAALLRGAADWPFPSLILGAVAAAAALLLLTHILRGWGLGPSRFLFAALLGLHPAFLQAAADGSNAAPVLFLALLTAAGLAAWQDRSERLRDLIGFAAGAALLSASSIDLLPWLATAFLLLALTERMRTRTRAQREAILILALLPSAAMLTLWFTMNWLIMGDVLYLVRPLLARPLPRAATDAWTGLGAPDLAAAALCLLVAGIGLLRRDRGDLAAGILGLSVPATAALLAAAGLLWTRVPAPYLVHPLAILAVAHASRPRPHRPRFRPRLLALLVAAALTAGYHVGPPRPTPGPAETQPFGFAQAERNLWLPRIEAHLRRQDPRAIVFVCGFESFLLLGHEAAAPFLHALDFDVRAAEDAFPGHPLFLLVHEPRNRGMMDSIHWRYEQLYELGSPHTLYNSDWGPWRLFEIVRAPR